MKTVTKSIRNYNLKESELITAHRILAITAPTPPPTIENLIDLPVGFLITYIERYIDLLENDLSNTETLQAHALRAKIIGTDEIIDYLDKNYHITAGKYIDTSSGKFICMGYVGASNVAGVYYFEWCEDVTGEPVTDGVRIRIVH